MSLVRPPGYRLETRHRATASSLFSFVYLYLKAQCTLLLLISHLYFLSCVLLLLSVSMFWDMINFNVLDLNPHSNKYYVKFNRLGHLSTN